jgi:anti-sigma28 factor (negative regulator of flagellin synthesis)
LFFRNIGLSRKKFLKSVGGQPKSRQPLGEQIIGEPTAMTPTSDPICISITAREALPKTGNPAVGGLDSAKVCAVRAAIADGSFRIDPGAIADKFLANAQEVLSLVRGGSADERALASDQVKSLPDARYVMPQTPAVRAKRRSDR